MLRHSLLINCSLVPNQIWSDLRMTHLHNDESPSRWYSLSNYHYLPWEQSESFPFYRRWSILMYAYHPFQGFKKTWKWKFQIVENVCVFTPQTDEESFEEIYLVMELMDYNLRSVSQCTYTEIGGGRISGGSEAETESWHVIIYYLPNSMRCEPFASRRHYPQGTWLWLFPTYYFYLSENMIYRIWSPPTSRWTWRVPRSNYSTLVSLVISTRALRKWAAMSLLDSIGHRR